MIIFSKIQVTIQQETMPGSHFSMQSLLSFNQKLPNLHLIRKTDMVLILFMNP